MSVDLDCLASLLTEALAEIDDLSRRLSIIEKKLESLQEMSLSFPDSNNNNGEHKKNTPLTISLNNESNNTNIDRAIDCILKLGRNIPYISEK